MADLTAMLQAAAGAVGGIDPREHFGTLTYTGTGGVQTVTTSDIQFTPDWMWFKRRSGSGTHYIYDIVRSAAFNRSLNSDSTNAEATTGSKTPVFGGVQLNESFGGTNGIGATFVAWSWKANGAGSSNTAGTITSTVSANTTAGISIVTYTGTGSAATVGHGIGVAPKMVIVKSRSATDSWYVYHASLGAANRIQLNQTNASTGTSVWNSTSPTSTVFSVGPDSTNTSTVTYVAYCFAEVGGFSKFGSYTGNGSTDGPFVYTGFRPAFIIIKAYNQVANWQMLDTARNPTNAADKFFRANSDIAEATNYPVDILSNGFKLRNTDGDYNVSASYSYIFMAFSSNPFKTSLAR